MPNAAPKPCCQCSVLVLDGTTRCPAHKARAGTFADRGRGSRHERGYGTAWEKKREAVLRRDAGLCQPCRRHGIFHSGREVDHIVNKARGGTDDESNLQTICREVHQAKTDAEKLGLVWNEREWFEAQAAAPARPAAPHLAMAAVMGGGVQMSAALAPGTAPEENSCAREFWGRGYPPPVAEGAL